MVASFSIFIHVTWPSIPANLAFRVEKVCIIFVGFFFSSFLYSYSSAACVSWDWFDSQLFLIDTVNNNWRQPGERLMCFFWFYSLCIKYDSFGERGTSAILDATQYRQLSRVDVKLIVHAVRSVRTVREQCPFCNLLFSYVLMRLYLVLVILYREVDVRHAVLFSWQLENVEKRMKRSFKNESTNLRNYLHLGMIWYSFTVQCYVNALAINGRT